MKDFITLPQLCSEYSFSKSWVYKKSAAGILPCYRPTMGRLYFVRSEIEDFLSKGKKDLVNKSEIIILNTKKR